MKYSRRVRSFITLIAVFSGQTLLSLPADAQFNIPGLSIPGLPQVNIPGMETLFKGEEAVSTGIKDARGEVIYLDSYSPSAFKPLTALGRGSGGGWRLRPGLYGGDIRSYCLHAGTYGPTRGDGYLYAPLKGKRRGVIQKILHNSAEHPDLPQHDIQSLIWAIESRSKFDTLPSDLQRTASTLLSPQDILELNGASLDYMTDEMKGQAFGKLSDSVRPVYEAQNSLRGLFTSANVPFDQLERVAVLTGNPPKDKNSRDIPGGRWSLHPGGYFVRYLPMTYSRTTLQLYVPERFAIKRDLKGRILSVLDPQGSGVETDYNDNVPPLTTTDRNFIGYGFASIRLIKNGKSIHECKQMGWSFVGSPKDKNVRCDGAAGYVGSAARLQDLLNLLRQMDDYKKTNTKPKSGWGNPADTLDLASYRRGIEEALRDCDAVLAPTSDVLQFEPQLSEILIHAWQSADCGWAEGPPDGTPPSDPGDEEYDPSGDVATPGDTGRQRLGQSCAPFSSD